MDNEEISYDPMARIRRINRETAEYNRREMARKRSENELKATLSEETALSMGSVATQGSIYIQTDADFKV